MLSLKRILIKILDRFGRDAYTLTNSSLVNGYARVCYDNATKTVRVSFYFNSSSAIPTSEDIFSGIKSAHRPSSTQSGTFVGTNANGTFSIYQSRITTSGGIRQALSATCTSGIGYIEYVAGGVIPELIHRFKTACTSLRKGVMAC